MKETVERFMKETPFFTVRYSGQVSLRVKLRLEGQVPSSIWKREEAF